MPTKFYEQLLGQRDYKGPDYFVVSLFKNPKISYPTIQSFVDNNSGSILSTCSYLVRGTHAQAVVKAKELAKLYPSLVVRIAKYTEEYKYIEPREPFEVKQI